MANNTVTAPTLPNTDGILWHQAGQATKVRIQAGQHLKVRKHSGALGTSEAEVPDNLVATRHGDDLHIRYADGGSVTLESFYSSCTDSTVCSVNLVGDSGAGLTLGADMASGASIAVDGGTLVYAHGQHEVMMAMAQGQPGLGGAMVSLGNTGALSYLPQTASVAATADAGFSAAPLLGGAAALTLAASGLSNVTASGSGTAVSPTSIVQGTIQAGPITTGNDLEVAIYAADRTTLLQDHVAVDSSGHFSTNVGSYTGVVFAKLVNKGTAADYLDEATNTGKDLSAPLIAMGVVLTPGSTLSLNLNVLTTLAANKAEANPSAASAAAINTAVAHAFGLASLQDTTVVPTNGGNYNAADGISEGEKYGALLAGFSGMDKLNGGNVQTTLDQVASQLTLVGSSATLSDSIKYDITAGAKVVAAAASNQAVVTSQFGDSVATLINYQATTLTESQGLATIGQATGGTAATSSPTAFDYANANVTGVDSSARLQLINDVLKTKVAADVDSTAELQALADAVAAVLVAAAGGTPPTLLQLQALGLHGVTAGNLGGVLAAIANSADDGSAVDTQAEIQALVDAVVNPALSSISAYAQANSASAPTSPTGSAPTRLTYADAGVTGVDSSNLGAINDALATSAITGTQADTAAEIQAIVNAYSAILTEANGATVDATPSENPTAVQYAAIGAELGAAATDAENLALLNSLIGAQSSAGVDSVAEINNLARIANAIQLTAAGGTPSPALTATDLALMGLTGVTAGNLGDVLAAITAQADDGSATASIDRLQALTNSVVSALTAISTYAETNSASAPASPTGSAPTLLTYGDAGVTAVDSSNLGAINDALATSAITGTQADTPAEIQAIVNAYSAILAEANGATADATAGVNPSAAQYAAIGADIGAAASDAENLALLNDIVGSQASTGVDTVAEINNLARIANAIELTAAGGTPSPALTAADLALIGITGVTADNLSGLLQVIANQTDTGTATDSLAELQTLANAVNSALGVVSAYAQANTASAPNTPTGTAPTLLTYGDAGVTGVDNTNLAAINDALTTSAITGTQADTQAEIQAIVNAYTAILAEANGATADATPGTNPSAAQYAAIGADVGAAASDAENLALLNDILGAQSSTGVDTVAEINNLARIANAIELTAAGGTPSPALTATDLTLIGLTGVTADNLSGLLRVIANQTDSGSATDSLAELQNLVNAANTALNLISAYADVNTASAPTAPIGNAPALSDYIDAGVTGVDGSNRAAINDALTTGAVNGAAADTPAEIQTLVNAYNAILAEANGATADATPGTNPSAAQYAAIGADIGAAASDAENLALLNGIVGSQASTGVDTVAEINNLARIANAIQLTAAGGTPSPALTAADLGLVGIAGVTTANLGSVLASIAAQADSGSATDSLPELQALVDAVVSTALGVVSAYAQANTASAPASPTGSAPTLSTYGDAGVTGVDSNNLAAINDALATSAITGTQADTPAEIQAIVNAYSAILAEANGATADATPGVNPSAAQYAAIGADIGAAASDAENLALLNDIVGAQASTGVDTVAEINNLARIANAIELTAAGGTPSPALTAADLTMVGLTGVTTDNLGGLLQVIANQTDSGTATDSLAELQALADAVATALGVVSAYAQANTASAPTTPTGTAPTLATYSDAGVTGVDSSNLAAINDALTTNAVTGTQADTAAEIQAIVNAYSAILAEANGATADATPGVNPTAAQYAAIGADIGLAVSDAENLALLNDTIGSKAAADVDTVAEINQLAAAVSAVTNQAAGITGLTMANLAALGITVATDSLGTSGAISGLSAVNIQNILAAISATADSGTGVDTLAKIQALVNAAVDLTPPAAPVITTIATDNTINAAEQGAAISGTAEANAVITVSLGGLSHSVSADGSGNWSYTLQPADISAMGQGAETLSATATDAAGNVSSAGTRAISIDTLAPTLAVGALGGDGTLNAAERNALDASTHLAISGSTSGVEDGQSVSITLNYIQYSATVTGNVWSLDLPNADALALNHGNSYTATASVTDAAGNVSNVGSSAVLIDIATPDIPTVHQQVTNNTHPTLTGHAEKTLDSGATFIKLDGGTSDVISVVVNSITYNLTIGATSSPTGLTYNTTSGDWALDLSGAANPMTNGDYEVAVSVTAGGLTKTDISLQELKINTTAVVVAMASITSDNAVNAAEAGGSVLLHGTSSNLEAGRSVTLTLVDGSTVQATVQADGSWSTTVAGSSFNLEGAQQITANATNAAGTAATPLVHNLSVDTVLPTASVALSSAALLAGQTATLTVTFNEAVSGFDNNDLSIGNGTLSAVSSSDGGITWTATFTPSADLVSATNAITLNKAGVSDAAGNAGAGSSSTANYAIDTHRPSATITLSDSALKAGETATVTLTFSEAVSGLANGDLGISNGTLSPVSSSDGGITWTATFTPTADFTAAGNFLTLNNSGVSNTAGNAGAGQTSSGNYAIDTHVPVVSAVSDGSGAAITKDAITFTVTFDEALTGTVGVGNFSATNGSVTSVVAVDSSHYTVVVTPTAGVGSGTVALSLIGTGLTDAAGNALANANLSGLDSQGIDTRAPSVSSVTDSSGAITKDAISFSVTFDEAITGTIDLGSFSASNGSVTSVTTSDNIHYTVVVTPTAGIASGNVALTLLANGQTDAVGNPLQGADLTGLNSQAIDTVVPNAPTINLVAGDDLLNLAESTGTVTGTCEAGASVALVLGGTTRAVTVSGTTWSYTLQAGDITNMGQGAETLSATQTDAAGNTSVAGTRDITVDTLAPNAPTINLVAGDDILNLAEAGGTITGTCEAGASVALALGGNTRAATVSGTTWSYTLVAADITAMGQGAETLSATQTDAAGNTSVAGTRPVSVDTAAPSASVTTATLAPSGNASVQSTETGTAYLVSSTVTVNSLADITGAADALWNQASIGTANSNTNLALTGLNVGAYKLYTVDAAGNLSAASTNTLTVDNPPVNTVPSTLTLNEDTATVITGLSVADPDAGTTLTVTLSALHGTLVVPNNIASGVTSVSNSGTASVTLTGTVAEINATLAAGNGVTYTPDANYNGSDTLTLLSSDGAMSDSDAMALTVTAVNDAPVLASASITNAAALYTKTGDLLLTPSFTANSAVTGGFGLTDTATKTGTAAVLDATYYWIGSGASQGTLNLSFNTPVSNVTVTWQYQTNTGAGGEFVTLSANGSVITPTIGNLTSNGGGVISLSGNTFVASGENSTLASYSYSAAGITSFSISDTITSGSPNGIYAKVTVRTPGAGTLLSSLAPAVTDVDAASSVKGYAITSAAANSTDKWQYSTDSGAHWRDLTAATVAAAIYLAPTDKLRWTGVTDTETALSMVAVDNSGGALHGAGDVVAGTLNVTTRGGSTAYSASLATLAALSTPLVLDLNGDGIKTLAADHGVLFDVANHGVLGATGWASANDGMLVHDINHDGRINNGSELFGNGTLLADGNHAANGFAALAQFDSNHDGRIDAQDAIFNALQVWQDSNSDGVSQATELHSLLSLGIASINLDALKGNALDNGNTLGLVSGYTSTDGSVHALADVWFSQGAQVTVGADAQGYTTLNMVSSDQSLDLTALGTAQLHGVNHIDLSGAGVNSLSLDLSNVVDMAGTNLLNSSSMAALGWTGGSYVFSANESAHQLVINGDSADQVHVRGGFTDTGLTATINGHTYEVYNQGNVAQLLIEQSLNRSAVM